MSAIRLSLVIPTWNGLDLLQTFLPGVVEELERWEKNSGLRGELVLSDDGSTDGTASWLAAHLPRARLTRAENNRGFADAANAGVASATAEIVVLLNNDVALAVGALDAVLAPFAAPELFGITFRALDLPERRFATGGKLGRYRRGFWSVWDNYDVDIAGRPHAPAAVLPTFLLVGGFCALRRAPFLDLGGFDPMFSPYYWEDIDLTYRARKRGWHTQYEPAVEVYHRGSASVSRHRGAWRRQATVERNRLLFHWRNLDASRLPGHLAWAHLLLLSQALAGRFAYHAGYVSALRRLPGVWRYRRRERGFWRLRDRDLAVAAPSAAPAHQPGQRRYDAAI